MKTTVEESQTDKRPRIARRDKRVLLALPAHYSCQSSESEESAKPLLAAMVRDFSESGVCIFTGSPMTAGDRMTVFCDHLWHEGKGGTVAWCRTLDTWTHKVGIELD